MEKKSFKNTLVVLAIFLMLISTGAVTASLQSIMEAFPEAPISSVYLILSLPTVFMMVVSYVSGWLTSKNVPYKGLAVFGLVLLTAAGIFPVFLNSVGAILVARAIFGIGVGLINPMGNTLAVLYFGPEEGGKVIGYGNASMNLGCIACTMVGGILCGISWRYTFLSYLIGLLPLIVVVFLMKEPEGAVAAGKSMAGPEAAAKLPGKVCFLSVLLFLGQMIIYPLYLNLSSIVMLSIPGGTPAIAGTALSVVNVAGMVVGALFGVLYKGFHRFTLAVGYILGAIGLYLVSSTGSMTGIFIACFLCGLNNTILMVGIMNEVGMTVDRSAMSKASGTAMAFCSLAPLAATVYATLVNKIPNGDSMRYIFFVGAIGNAILAVIWILTNLKRQDKTI